MRDNAILQAQWVHDLLDEDENFVFQKLARLIRNYRQFHDEHACHDLIVMARAFTGIQNDPRFDDRMRALYLCAPDDDPTAQITRRCFTHYPPTRTGLPHTDAANAQTLISQPLGVQKMHARSQQRGHQEALLFSPWPPVIEILCQNPTIQERDILLMASRRPTQNDLLQPILASHWSSRPEVRFALAANPYISASHAMRCALSLPRQHLEIMSDMPEIHDYIRQHIRLLLEL